MSKLFRALPVHFQAWLIEHGWVLPLAALAMIAVVLTLIFARPDHYEKDGYVIARVLASADTSSESGFSIRFSLKLPSDEVISAGTHSLQLATQVVELACLERRNHKSGRTSYKLVQTNLCERADT